MNHVEYAEGWQGYRLGLRRAAGAIGSEMGLRVAVVLAALVILFLRAPITFTHPQFWGEDADFFTYCRTLGLGSLKILLAGYLCTAQALVALLASFFSPELAAALYCYAAILMTLGVVYMLTSPRLEMPGRALLAIAVVAVPPGFEVLGNLANSQWILAIGVFGLLFTRAAKARWVAAAEAGLVGVTAFTGPFSVFLTPLFVLRCYQTRPGEGRKRMGLFAALSFSGAATQILMIATHPQYASLGARWPHPWTLWLTVPYACLVKGFGPIAGFLPSTPGAAMPDALLAVALAAVALWLAWRQPYRTQKLFILFFGAAVAASGMWKNRETLETLGLVGGARYFYIPDVLAFWFVCCLGAGVYSRALVLTLVAAAEIMLLPAIKGTPRVAEDMAWPIWARLIESGLPVLIPTSPPGGWLVHVPAAADGKLAGYSAWIGRPIAQMAQTAAACDGSLAQIAPFIPPNLWMVSGSAWPAALPAPDAPVRVVALVDGDGIVDGFALPGFKAGAGAPAGAGWNAVVQAQPGALLRAYAILGDGRACALANGRYAQAGNPVGGGAFFGAVPIVPGQDIAQAFKPLHRFDRLDVRFVAYARVPSDYKIGWEIDAVSQGVVREIGAGTIAAERIGDWKLVSLPVATLPDAVPGKAVLYLRAQGSAPALPAGVPLYLPASGNGNPAASIGGAPMSNGAQINLIPDYVQ